MGSSEVGGRAMSASAPAAAGGVAKRLVPAVLGAMHVLDHVVAVGSAKGSEVQAAVGLNASTCHGILKTLVHGGYLDYDPVAKQYSLGAVLVAHGATAKATDFLTRATRPFLRRWVHETLFTAFVGRWLPDHTIVIVDKIESTRDIKMTVEIGQRFPATAAALSKAFIAFMDPREQAEVIAQLSFPAYTENSVRDAATWKAELERVRRLGWSESHAEYYSSTNAVAAPVRNPSGEVLFVVGSLAAVTDLPRERLGEYGVKIRDLASEIEQALFPKAYRAVSQV